MRSLIISRGSPARRRSGLLPRDGAQRNLYCFGGRGVALCPQFHLHSTFNCSELAFIAGGLNKSVITNVRFSDLPLCPIHAIDLVSPRASGFTPDGLEVNARRRGRPDAVGVGRRIRRAAVLLRCDAGETPEIGGAKSLRDRAHAQSADAYARRQ